MRSHRLPVIVVSVLMLLVGIAGWSHVASARAARSEVETYVTVIDGDRRPVRGLTEEDFALRDGGIRQHVLDVSAADGPLAITVVELGFDAAELADAHAAVAAARRPLAAADARHRMDTIEPGANDARASVMDTIVHAAESLRSAPTDRRIVLALLRRRAGDGAVDQPSRLTDALLRGRVALWTLEAGPSQSTALDKVLTEATALGGALRETVSATTAMAASSARIADLLTSQYVVRYMWPDPMLSQLNITIRHERGEVLKPGWNR